MERRSDRELGQAKKEAKSIINVYECRVERSEQAEGLVQNFDFVVSYAQYQPCYLFHLLWLILAFQTASNYRLSLARRRSASTQCTRNWTRLNSLLMFFGTETDLEARIRININNSFIIIGACRLRSRLRDDGIYTFTNIVLITISMSAATSAFLFLLFTIERGFVMPYRRTVGMSILRSLRQGQTWTKE